MGQDSCRLVVMLAMLAFGCGSVAGDPEGDRPTGDPCSWGAQCEGGVCINEEQAGLETGWAGGMCTSLCSQGQCGPGQNCVDLTDAPYCLPACTANLDSHCREGYVCHSLYQVCFPDCRMVDFCIEGYVCSGAGECVFDWPLLTPVGGPCQEHADCASGWCLFESGPDSQPTGWQGGTCSLPCGAGCPPGTSCAVLAGAGWCLQPCMGPPDSPACREDYICDPDYHVCLPDCRNDGWECGPNFKCNMMGVCVPPGGPGPGPGPGR